MATNGKKSRKKLIIFSVIGLVIIVLGLIVFLGSKKEPVLAVNVEKVSTRTLTQVVTATGKMALRWGGRSTAASNWVIAK